MRKLKLDVVTKGMLKGVLFGVGMFVTIVGGTVGLTHLVEHKDDNERASSSCYSIFETSYQLYPDTRMFILKAKADKLFTKRECRDLMAMTDEIREKERLAEQDQLLNVIGESPVDSN